MKPISFSQSNSGFGQNSVELPGVSFGNNHFNRDSTYSGLTSKTSTPTALYGLAGDDFILGTAQKPNVLFGNDGNDRLQGFDRQDVLNGGAGEDILIGNRGDDSLVGGSGDDRLTGNSGNDSLKGGSGKDQLVGSAGKDYLDGGAGIDQLDGGSGDDVLMDYEGGDRLTGGQGFDQFGVGSPISTAVSVITDFKAGIDQIKILRLGATFKDLSFRDRSGGTEILDQGKVIALLENVKSNSLKPSSFIFGDQQLAGKLQKNLEQSLAAKPQATGLSATVFAPDGTLWQGFAGVASRETKAPVNANSLFGIGSITKPIVATTVLQLQQEGKLNLNDTVSQWLPNLANIIPNGDRITIRQLLGHTSGIRNYTDEPALIDEFTKNPSTLSKTYTTQELLAFIKDKPALAEPGQAFSYSNSNYILLGEIIEKATGSTLASQLRQRIFKPLGMTHTFFAPQEPIAQGTLTRTYADLNDDGKLEALNEEGLSWAGAAGGVVSTSVEVAKFAQALFQGELLAPATLQQMINDYSDLGSSGKLERSRYGLGVESGRISQIGRFLRHNGATVGWGSEMTYLPDRPITATTLGSQAQSPDGKDATFELLSKNIQSTVNQYPSLSR